MSCAAQKKASVDAKVVAYKQNVIPGVPPQKRITEGGKDDPANVEPHMPRANYMIYLEGLAPNAQVMQMWVNEKTYSVTTEKVQTPLIMFNPTVPGTKPDTLVRATSAPVIQVMPAGEISDAKPSSGMSKMVKNNEVVIECLINGKTYYYTAKAIKNLSPLALQ